MRRPSLMRAGLLAAALALAGCSDPPAEEQAAVPAPVPAIPPAAPVVPEPAPAPSPEAQAVAQALADVQAFNAATAEELAGIGRAEQQIGRAADRALELANRPGAAGASRQIAAARGEAERARAGLTTGLAAFQAASAERTAQLDAALEQCEGVEGLAASEPCVLLTAEQPLLTQNIAALAERYQAADAVWRRERAKLDEASAVIALGR